MSTPAQQRANRDNAQYSTGPKTAEGKAESSLNRLQFGLTGDSFVVMPWEKQEEYNALIERLNAEHQPETPIEEMLVQKMAQHYWLSQRALLLQDLQFSFDRPSCETADDERQLALFMRYHTSHERSFQRYWNELRSHRKEKENRQIGFESQKRAQVRELRHESEEMRKEELHQARLRLLHARIARLEAPPVARITPKLGSGGAEATRTDLASAENPLEMAA